MVCLYAAAINGVTKKNINEEFWEDDAPWNWLIHDLGLFIYKKSGFVDNIPSIPVDSSTAWGRWFSKVLFTLKKEFYDANEILTFRVLENCPTEEVALMIFNTIEIRVIMEFLTTCLLGAG